jgi:hypothetical protein
MIFKIFGSVFATGFLAGIAFPPEIEIDGEIVRGGMFVKLGIGLAAGACAIGCVASLPVFLLMYLIGLRKIDNLNDDDFGIYESEDGKFQVKLKWTEDEKEKLSEDKKEKGN